MQSKSDVFFIVSVCSDSNSKSSIDDLTIRDKACGSSDPAPKYNVVHVIPMMLSSGIVLQLHNFATSDNILQK